MNLTDEHIKALKKCGVDPNDYHNNKDLLNGLEIKMLEFDEPNKEFLAMQKVYNDIFYSGTE